MAGQAEEVDWDRLDKRKMLVYGAGMFSSVTVALYPLSVIKTKQMTLPGISGGFEGVKQTASTIMRSEGVPGFYRGFGTVVFGTIPARAVYLTTLEWVKSETAKGVGELGITGPAAALVANGAGGAAASLATQSVTVPIDVISQKQMVHGDETVVARHQHSRAPAAQATAATGTAARPAAAAAAGGGAAAAGTAPSGGLAEASTLGRQAGSSSAHAAAPSLSSAGQPHAAAGAAPVHAQSPSAAAATRSGASASTSGRPAGAAAAEAAEAPVVRRVGSLQMVRLIIKEEGIAGLYRGFGASVATFVPSSAVWWGAYGAYQKVIWSFRQSAADRAGGSADGQGQGQHSANEVLAVQTVSSILAGCTSSLVTTPLDLIKTRIQVSYKHDGATPTFSEVTRQILREDGAAGFLRGAVPRMLNASLWGTCMVTVYEYLKRVCAKDD